LGEARRSPTLTDYIAGGLLSNCLVWFWFRLISGSGGLLSGVSVRLLGSITYVVFFIAGLTASYLVCTRTLKGHLGVGVKSAGVNWAISIFIVIPLASTEVGGLSIALLACYLTGGIISAYIALNVRIRRRRRERRTGEGEEALKSENSEGRIGSAAEGEGNVLGC
jgi:hypothetical protein